MKVTDGYIEFSDPKECGWLLGQEVEFMRMGPDGYTEAVKDELCELTTVLDFAFEGSEFNIISNEIRIPIPKLSELKDEDVIRFKLKLGVGEHISTFKRFKPISKLEYVWLLVSRGVWIPVEVDE